MNKENFLNDIREMYNKDDLKAVPTRFQFMSTTYWGWKCGCPVGVATMKHCGITYSDAACIDFCLNHYNLSLPYIQGIVDGFDGVGKWDSNEYYKNGYEDGAKLYEENKDLMDFVDNIYLKPESKNESPKPSQ